MDLTFKQKIIAFGLMLFIFMASLFLKTWLNSGFDFQNIGKNGLVSGGDLVQTSIESEEEGTESAQSDSYDGEDGRERDSEGIIPEDEIIIIDVEGAVMYPGIVKVRTGSRVYQVIDKAGGLLDTADTKYVNLAEEVTDGVIIYIPFQGESDSSENGAAGSADSSSSGNGLININTAEKEKLMELPGIGETYAQAIIDYRNSSGLFKKKEDIKNVSGIGDAKYDKFASLICVY